MTIIHVSNNSIILSLPLPIDFYRYLRKLSMSLYFLRIVEVTVNYIILYIILMIFFPIAGGYFVAVRGRLLPDKLLLNNYISKLQLHINNITSIILLNVLF